MKHTEEKTTDSLLEIVKEDILRILEEEKHRKISLEQIVSRVMVSGTYVSQAVKELEITGLVQLDGSFLGLTDNGRCTAEQIVRKHTALENYFRTRRGTKQAHKAADILEHCVSTEIINDMRKLSTFKGEDVSLVEIAVGHEGLITDIRASSTELFERIVSMGILPGENIKILSRIPDGVVVDIGGKKFALGEEIAQGVRVL